ncbi:hypothetical protein A2232_01065 [candidate division WOR-1 bacterium RIFOXYA2_FULL_46_56]|uniref:Knr4/Smi1-like domain-containing protein n=1 Tax=candidate division WOR-1 bacterium RIFOXYC2_FULL_46_14 TaxID=1802587 RepID=A0A1F4U7K5_UNCSA|nr:MAG: hypothetical protein A2232_01065 [candidate division WOR-1 bacterium RIFOXYA2_FULL_46_56]OGC40869.1 MAG: hypothetical protein A2438_01065 [candidate division WOR-1 bacterium RIFOXYC2_FULL_46_14]
MIIKIKSIKDRLNRVRSSGWKQYASCGLGIDRHQFKMDPPLTELQAAAFEKEHSIALPSDYRSFLLEVGNGGAGPYYGILPLSRWNDAGDGLLSAEFSLDDPSKGAITICEQGCTYYSLLIVTGKDRGKVGNYDMQSREVSLSPFNNFVGWYNGWLDLVLKKEKIEWFGYQ